MDIKNRYTAPLDKFTAEVNDVKKILQNTADKIGSTITEFDEKRRLEKKTKVVEYFTSQIGNLAGLVTYQSIEDVKWYNATTNFKRICSEIDEKLSKINEDLLVIENLNTTDKDGLKAFYFRSLNLKLAMEENERLLKERALLEERKTKVIEVADKPTDNRNYNEREVEFSIRFEVTGTATEFQNLKKFLKENNIKYKAIKEN